jgi:hypothetical protein
LCGSTPITAATWWPPQWDAARSQGTCRFRWIPTLPSSHTRPGVSQRRHLSKKTHRVKWPLSQTATGLILSLLRKTSALDTYMATLRLHATRAVIAHDVDRSPVAHIRDHKFAEELQSKLRIARSG